MASLLLLFLALALAPAPAPAIQPRPEAKPSDTDALTIFRQLADAHGILASNWSTPDACSGRWRGVGCSSSSSSSGGPARVTSLSLPALDLRGTLVPLAHLDQLRVLDLHGNRLNGTLLPLLAALPNLKLLYLAGNELSGDIPSVALGRLSRLLRLDLAGNDLHGPIPAAAALANLTRLLTLRLQNNLLSGRVPDLSAVLPRLAEFNASNNELYGPVPDGMRAKFGLASFAGNAGLCGPAPPLPPCSFMPHESPPSSVSSSPESSSSSSSQSVVPSNPSSMPQRGGSGSGGDQMIKAGRRGNGSGREGLSGRAIVGIAVANAVFLLVVLSLIGAYCCFAGGSLQQEQKADKRIIRSRSARAGAGSGGDGRGGDAHDLQQGQGLGDEEDERGMRKRSCRYSSDGSCDEAQNKLVFFEEEEEEEDDINIIVNGSGRSKLRRGIRAGGGRRRPRRFELEELLRASAEMLGKGSVGTVYRAVLEDGCMVAVKRLKDANPCPRKEFHKYMELIGRLRHPNLVRLWAYYYAKQEKLLIYSYLPNASLHTLLHGN